MTTKIDTTKLHSDILEALTIAKGIAAKSDDGGTCNFDAPALRFDRMPRAKQREEIEAACQPLNGFWTKRYRTSLFVFGPGCGGQGNSRTRAAEAMVLHLEGKGYEMTTWYQAD